MADQMESLLERLDDLERRVEGLESRFDKYGGDLNTRVNGYQQQLDQLIGWVEEVKNWAARSFEVSVHRIEALESQVKSLEASASSQAAETALHAASAANGANTVAGTWEDTTGVVPSVESSGLEDLRRELIVRLEVLERQVAEWTVTQPAETLPPPPAPESSLIPVELPAEPSAEETGGEDFVSLPDAPVLSDTVPPTTEEIESNDATPSELDTLPVVLTEDSEPSPTPVALDLDALVEEALAREETERAEDTQALRASQVEMEHWGGLCRRLQEGIAATQEHAGTILTASLEAKEALPTSVQERLEGRQRGLELIGKMLFRLLEKPTLDVPDLTPPPLPTHSREEWTTLLASETEEDSARKRIEGQLRRVGTERFRVVAEYRALAEGTRRRFKDFLTRQAFPVLDGVDDGERHSAELQAQFGEEEESTQATLARWMQSYTDLRSLLQETLAQVGVTTMVVQAGEEVDYERHEPFDTETDENLPNEHVKSLVRNGYEYHDADETLLLRPAQVIVVKN